MKNKHHIPYLPEEEEQELINNFYTELDKVVKENNFAIYNNSSNSKDSIFNLLLDYADLLLIPDTPNDNFSWLSNQDKNSLYMFNLLHSDENFYLELLKQYINDKFNLAY